MEIALSLLMGLALAAACGFRVFVPLLVVSVAARAGVITLLPALSWVGSDTAVIVLAVATLLEILGYYIPWVDHALDVIASPAAVIAGVIASASVLTGIDPTWGWVLAVIAGGGAAGAVQTMTVAARAGSLATTGGLANPVVATIELVLAVVLSILALLLPVLAVAAAVIVLTLLARRVWRGRRASDRRQDPRFDLNDPRTQISGSI